jgi:hypothetical protein
MNQYARVTGLIGGELALVVYYKIESEGGLMLAHCIDSGDGPSVLLTDCDYAKLGELICRALARQYRHCVSFQIEWRDDVRYPERDRITELDIGPYIEVVA